MVNEGIEQVPAAEQRARGAGGGTLAFGCMTAIGAVCVLLVGAGLGYLLAFSHSDPEPEPAEPPVQDRLAPSSAVVVAVRDLAQLQSASYHVERVIDLQREQQRLFGLVKAQDAILLVAAADVTAGVDLTRMGEGDITIDLEARSVSIVLPPAQLLSTRLDSERTYVHTRDTDLLARRDDVLESEARRRAEGLLQQAALDAGLLARAEKNSARTVETLVRSLGYDRVEVRHRKVQEVGGEGVH